MLLVQAIDNIGSKLWVGTSYFHPAVKASNFAGPLFHCQFGWAFENMALAFHWVLTPGAL